jgi:hypothetical protein
LSADQRRASSIGLIAIQAFKSLPAGVFKRIALGDD